MKSAHKAKDISVHSLKATIHPTIIGTTNPTTMLTQNRFVAFASDIQSMDSMMNRKKHHEEIDFQIESS